VLALKVPELYAGKLARTVLRGRKLPGGTRLKTMMRAIVTLISMKPSYLLFTRKRYMKKIYLVVLVVLGFHLSANTQTISKNDNSLGVKLDSILTKEFKPNEPGCAVLVSRKDQIVYRKAFGIADLELNIPIQPEMVFEIASNTKQFTAVAIMQLVEQGKIKLQDSIEKYIPDYPPQGYGITIEHLLTNTSGIKDFGVMEQLNPTIWRVDHKPVDFIEFFKNEKMDFAPGTQYNYSNSGFFLLGFIIEEISGMTYEQYLEKNIFEPAGMTNSGFNSYNKIVINRVKGYSKGESGFENGEYVSPTIFYSAGGLLSTVDDFYKYYGALNSYKLITKESINKIRTSFKLVDGKETGYGYGIQVRELDGYKTIAHAGGGVGFYTMHWYFPEKDVHFIIFTNCDNYMEKDNKIFKMAKLSIENGQ
jgi:CubicO group peptidase (beta-lactamase class C family)